MSKNYSFLILVNVDRLKNTNPDYGEHNYQK